MLFTWRRYRAILTKTYHFICCWTVGDFKCLVQLVFNLMFTQVRTHFTFNTPRLIVHTCSEDCSEFTKSFSCPPLKNFLIFLAESEIRGLPAGKGPINRERNLGFDHTRPDSFLYRHEKFSGIVWTPIWYVTLHFKRSVRCSFAPSQKSRWNQRSYLWTEALSAMVFMLAQKLSGFV